MHPVILTGKPQAFGLTRFAALLGIAWADVVNCLRQTAQVIVTQPLTSGGGFSESELTSAKPADILHRFGPPTAPSDRHYPFARSDQPTLG